MQWLSSIGIGLVAGLLLNAAYHAISEGWPESYFGKSDGIESRIVSSPAKYLAFRLLPPFLAAVAAAATASRVQAEPAQLAVCSAALTHVSRNLWALAATRRRPVGRRFAWALYQLGIVILVSATMIAGYYASGFLAPLVPTPDEMVFSVWTAALVAILGLYFRRLLTSRSSDVRSRSLKSIPEGLIHHAMTKADEKGLDKAIVLGIMIFENAQRPSWVRSLERAVQKIARRGATTTQGLMQVRSPVPVSDRQSIDLKIQENDLDWRAPASLPNRDEWWFRQAERHNIYHRQEIYDAVYFAYQLIESDRVPGWSAPA